ncbi:MAG: protein phosphatase CheZ [Hyphomicrobiales bacterium]
MKSKVYRFESFSRNEPQSTPSEGGSFDNDQLKTIMDELAVLKSHICPLTEQADGSKAPQTNSSIAEAIGIKNELDQIYEAIAKTKAEIASINSAGMQQSGSTPEDELDAVVSGTESATNQILNAVEQVEADATTLANTLVGDEGLIAVNIQEKVLSIYEACNFQDITGQRITKVVEALRFVSERTDRMIEIWGGMDSFEGVEAESMDTREGDDRLKNGPSLETDDNVASQDDIDALFG